MPDLMAMLLGQEAALLRQIADLGTFAPAPLPPQPAVVVIPTAVVTASMNRGMDPIFV